MAKFKLVLDTRVKKKDDKFNLCVRYTNKSDVMYLNIVEMTLIAYQTVFEKMSMDNKSIEFREKCNAYITKAERIYSTIDIFDKQKFREKFYSKENEVKKDQTNGVTDLDTLFKLYLENSNMKMVTKTHYSYTLRVLKSIKSDVTLDDITTDFLNKLEHQKKIILGVSKATIDSWMRNLRAVINYHMKVSKLIPSSYEYPFGKSKFVVSSFYPHKQVLNNDEIRQIIDFDDFENKQQEYARNVWIALYRINGINYADLLQMKWSDIQGKFIVFTRRKTETTRKNNIKPIISPYTEKIKEVLDKIGDKNSPFILGKLKDGYSETTFNNCSHKNRQKINKSLSFLTEKLNLSVPLKIESARDCYATTLHRADKSIEQISEMLGHSNVIVTSHYLGSITPERTFQINDVVM